MVSILMILGGTLCGIEEEAVAFYPVLVPIFIAMGYDSIICVGSIFPGEFYWEYVFNR